jgi:hypothetical protein
MDAARRPTLYFLVGGLLLSVGTPIYLAVSRPEAAGYLLQPAILVSQTLPYLLGAALWLPSRSPRVSRIGVVLAGVLSLSSCLLYVSILTGIIPSGGDMLGFGFLMIDAVTTVTVIVLTLTAFALLRLRRQGPEEGGDL